MKNFLLFENCRANACAQVERIE